MSYKTILAYFNNDKQAKELLAVATRITIDNNAHLIGVYVVPKIWLNPAVSMEIPADFLSSQRQYYLDEAERIEALFKHETNAAGVSFEWRTLQSPDQKIAPVVVEQSRTADIVILSQSNEATDTDYSAEVPTAVLMESGRPVLVVPFGQQVKNMGEYVALGWNGTREATRAAFDALPFLETAKEVSLICVGSKKKTSSSYSVMGTELAATLARHDITATIKDIPENNSPIGAQLLEEATMDGGSLLIIGGYGHSRRREFIFGGATKYILENMTIPVLISH
ncbi:universal stress protein [Sneathiella litorea]|uniref:Universal stress protein family protein n=1 Tax=Sneathiella litorea TaxID=2606216 RepID=A0A6L8WAG4_9PROT|nr:universal stress protein [Sneathiella litorea]MZR31699.1 hypothetical protein [Sneathiella litorea]